MTKTVNTQSEPQQQEVENSSVGILLFRAIGQIAEGSGGEGEFTGYAARWDQVDSYGTRFKKGAFAASIKAKAKRGFSLLENHNTNSPVGLATVREDAIGLLVNGKLTLEVARAKELRALIQSGAVTGLSFGFRVKASTWDGKVEVYTDVDLGEISIVPLPAGEESRIDSIRSAGEDLASSESLQRKLVDMEQVFTASLLDVWRSENPTVEALDAILERGHAAYIDAASAFLNAGYTRSFEPVNKLAGAFQARAAGQSIEQIAAESPITVDECRALASGDLLPVSARERLREFDQEVFEQHQAQRAEKVAALAEELRAGGFTEPQKMRFRALLGEPMPDQTGAALQLLNDTIKILEVTKNV